MCLVAIAWQVHPHYPLILLGNRDELHQRPAVGADWWPEGPEVFGGRDLQSGGSWLGVSRQGRLALLTNNPQRPAAVGSPVSRGGLVRDWLLGQDTPPSFLERVMAADHHYPGFTLVYGSLEQGLQGLVTPGSRGTPEPWTLPAGLTLLSNGPRAAYSPKMAWLEAALNRQIARAGAARGADGTLVADEWLALMERRMPVAMPEGSGREDRARVTPFVTGPDFGTRAVTLLLADPRGGWRFMERRFGASGQPTGRSEGQHAP